MDHACELCSGDGGSLIHRAERWRVVAVEGAEGQDYPGFCRVIWNAHVKEMSDLSAAERREFMDAVFVVEAALIKALAPDKMNLASLGNMTPHLHWHVIPRRAGDRAFPKPIWAVAAGQVAASLGTLETAGPDGMAAWREAVRRALETP